MLEDFRLKVFVALAQQGNFTKAAAYLGISQPAVSQNIAELEKKVGEKLFERLRGEVVLTQAGVVFKDYAERVLNAYEEANSAFSVERKTNELMNVRVAVSEELYEFLIAPALKRFMVIHPSVYFLRTDIQEADLLISISPSTPLPVSTSDTAILRLKTSISQVGTTQKNKDGRMTILESYFDVLFQPSEEFSATKTCALLRDFLINL